jgi:hypothetical protein
VPHWKYVDKHSHFSAACADGLHQRNVHSLASRTVFIDADRYINESLGYWLAHELGHLATSSPREDNAEKAAHEYRKRLKQAHIEAR